MPIYQETKIGALQTVSIEVATNQTPRVNTNFATLDIAAVKRVLSRATGTPPGSPAEGDHHIVGSSPSGPWAGHTNHLAGWIGGQWIFVTAPTNYRTYVADEKAEVRWNGSSWVIDKAPLSHMVAKTANFTLSSTEALVYLVDATSGNLSIQAPNPATNPVRWKLIRTDNSGNTVTIVRNGSEKIQAVAADKTVIPGQFDSIELASDGTDWWIM